MTSRVTSFEFIFIKISLTTRRSAVSVVFSCEMTAFQDKQGYHQDKKKKMTLMHVHTERERDLRSKGLRELPRSWERIKHGVLFHGVPLDYLKWSTLKNNLGVKKKDFSKLESHLNVR